MNSERIFEIAHNIGRAAKEYVEDAAVFLGAATGVYATWEGIATGNKIETAIGVTSAVATSARVVWKFLPYITSIRSR